MNTGRLLSKLKRNATTKAAQKPAIDEHVFGKKLGLITRLVGCSHKDLGRPFVDAKTAYRSCINRGVRRPFNPETFETYGYYYCPPVNQL